MKALAILVLALWILPAHVWADDWEVRPIRSRVFESVAYRAAAQELIIEFSNGASYVYFGVPREVYLDFTRIVNKGEYFARRIRSVYAYERLRPSDGVALRR